MSDLLDEAEELAVPAPAEEKPLKKKPGRPKKTKAEGDEKKKVTIRRKARVTVKNAADKPQQGENQTEENAVAADIKEEKAEQAPLSEEKPAVAAEETISEAADSETPAAEATESNEDEAAQDNRQAQDGRKYDDRYHSGRRDKRMKNGKRRPMEEYPPEINLDEHPEAPQLFISVLTALHIDELRDRAREQGIPEDVILDCRKPELIARMLRLHSANGGALLVGVPLF